MAFDEQLADRVRELLAPVGPVVEKRMFSGLAFLLDGHITVAVVRDGLMVHVDPDESELLVLQDGVERMVMRGKPMAAWLVVDTGAVETDDALAPWVDRGVIAAKSMD